MGSATYYRKYRPQRFSELDAADIREGLQKILKSKNIPHAFLFAGPKGIGKTSAARLIAKSVNCLSARPETNGKQQIYEPCNKCDICREITDGASLDVIEIDAASNRGIDDIRNLREKVKLATSRCRYKVYIIDEVHMLTNEAFNALLKTLEEPPAHVIFILCTTQIEKLPETIVSRCSVFRFHKAGNEEIVRALSRAVDGEKLKAEKGVLEAIAKSVDGSFRDAHKILEQLSMAGKSISLEETKKLLGRTADLSPEKLLKYLAQNDHREALAEVNRVASWGIDLGVYGQRILEDLRILLLEKVGAKDLLKNGEEVAFKELLDLSTADLVKLIGLFSLAAVEMKTATITQLPLEIAVINWCGQDESAGGIQAKDPAKNNPSFPVSPSLPPSPSKTSLEEISRRWHELLEGIRPLNHSTEALLRAARPIELSGGYLTLEVFYKFHKERLESQKCREVIEQVIEEVLGIPLRVKYILGQKADLDEGEKASVLPQGGILPPEDDIIKTAAEIFGVGKSN